MRKKILKIILLLLASVLSGVLLILSFPTYDMGWLAWVSLAPLLIGIFGRSIKSGFFISYICGVIFFWFTFDWMFEVPKYTPIHHSLIVGYLAIFFGLFGLAFSFVSRKLGLHFAFLSAPFIWVSIEYLQSNLSFLSFPWALLSHSQYRFSYIIQIASLTGAIGVSFLVVMYNSTIALVILASFRWAVRPNQPADTFTAKRAALGMILASAALTALCLIHGYNVLSRPIPKRQFKVSVVQGNIDREKKGNPRKNSAVIMERYIDLSKKAAKDKAPLIVWPEAATPGPILKHLSLLKQMQTLVREINSYFLVGSSEYPKFQKKKPLERGKFGNTALFFSPEGKVVGQYLKIRLLPFSEYIPYKDIIPWPEFIVPKEKKAFEIPGKDFNIFEVDGARFGVVICWEVVFPEIVREFVKNGANFMINISNEGWFGKTAAPYQMVSINVLRAVENRRAFARASNTGISCFIDPYGRVQGRVRKGKKDIFVEGYLTEEVYISEQKTFYTTYGDIFVYISQMITFFIFILSFLKTRIGLHKISSIMDNW